MTGVSSTLKLTQTDSGIITRKSPEIAPCVYYIVVSYSFDFTIIELLVLANHS